jgi:(2Fe-2S) ferredoxin
MPEFTHHIFVCCNQRAAGHRRGCCDPTGNEELRNALKAEVASRGLRPLVWATKSGCLDQCEHGPVVAIYPQGVFYGHVTQDDVTRIVEETVLGGRVIEELQIAPDCLNNRNCEHIQEANERSDHGAPVTP